MQLSERTHWPYLLLRASAAAGRFQLSQHPEAEDKVVAELRGLGLLVTAETPEPRLFSPADRSKLPYLTCVIKVSCPGLEALVCITGTQVFCGQPGEPECTLSCAIWQHASGPCSLMSETSPPNGACKSLLQQLIRREVLDQWHRAAAQDVVCSAVCNAARALVRIAGTWHLAKQLPQLTADLAGDLADAPCHWGGPAQGLHHRHRPGRPDDAACWHGAVDAAPCHPKQPPELGQA